MIKELLKLIENVDKDDTVILDEIDMKTIGYLGLDKFHCTVEIDGKRVADAGYMFCTSIDAQEQIDAEGWVIRVTETGRGFAVTYVLPYEYSTNLKDLPTEPLARLHAKLQVVEYERIKQND